MFKRKVFSAEMQEINLTVTDDSDFLSPYAKTGKPIISQEVADFLENSAREFFPRDKLKLNIESDCIDEGEKIIYNQAVKNYFSLKADENDREIRRKTVASLWFLAVGIVALCVMLLLSSKGITAVWTECVDIFAWVFVWEAVDQFFIERNSLILRRKRLKSFIDMEINYC